MATRNQPGDAPTADLVKQLSDRAILLLNGRMVIEGKPNDVINRYIGLVLERQQTQAAKEERVRGSFRHGDGTSEILDVNILNPQGEATTCIPSGEEITIQVKARLHTAQQHPMVGILIRTRIGMDVYGTNTGIEQIDLGRLEAGQELTVNFRLQCWLTPHQYTLTVATQSADGSSHDWLDDAIAFEVIDTRVAAGVAKLRAKIEWKITP